MDIKKTLQNQWHDFTHLFEASTKFFISALGAEILTSGGKILEDAATAAVKAQAQTNGSNEDKFKAAIAAVIEVLATEGISYTITAVQGAVLAAYAQFKASNAG